ncbi:metal ABC transporter substrate-binding protein [Pedococcus sp. NPDC057267]|uniref:metal ABC transporter substrate-binding protein n=1 Tax=Pedococcus sp. NPDC057267 TaxID=3346077 RepID=UPI00363775C9
MLLRRSVTVLGLTALALAGVTACGSGTGTAADGSRRLAVSAAFYPLEYLVHRVGGDHVEVQGLTKPGGEPHDIELTPRQVGAMATADLVVYERGFQPAVDQAVRQDASRQAFDVSPAADLSLVSTEAGHAGESQSTAAAHGAVDPHFWLDPQRYAAVAQSVADRLAALDPTHATAYRDNAAALRADLTALDTEYRTGLASCRSKDLVTSHAAFGYLAQRYGLHQEGITGLDPEAEPNPAELAAVAAHVRAVGARTIYAETLVSPAVADTLARETGARVAVLDPIEGITSDSRGTDYLAVMRSNLQVLRSGQECT